MTASAPVIGSPLVVVTDRRQAAPRPLTDVVAAAIEGGARTVLLREKDLPRAGRRSVAAALVDLLRRVDGRLLVASDVGLAQEVGAAGVHMAAADRWPPAEVSEGLRVGRSCHSVDDLRAALTTGADYASLSPIWPSPSKPGYGPALGLTGLGEACAAVPGLPVVALGGVTPARAGGCRQAGAVAVAVMGDVMRAADPAEQVRALLAELHGAEPVPSEHVGKSEDENDPARPRVP